MSQLRTFAGQDWAAVPHACKGAHCSAWSPGCSKAAGFSKAGSGLSASGAREAGRCPDQCSCPSCLCLLKSWCRPHAILASLPLTQLVLLSASVRPRGPPAAGECPLDENHSMMKQTFALRKGTARALSSLLLALGKPAAPTPATCAPLTLVTGCRLGSWSPPDPGQRGAPPCRGLQGHFPVASSASPGGAPGDPF